MSDYKTRIDSDDGACRSAATNAALGIAAASPFLTVGGQALVHKLTGPKDDGQNVIIPSGTVRPDKKD